MAKKKANSQTLPIKLAPSIERINGKKQTTSKIRSCRGNTLTANPFKTSEVLTKSPVGNIKQIT